MSQQLTVRMLYKRALKEIHKGNGEKMVVISDDTEGNGYHGLFFGFTSSESGIKECLEASNGIYDSESENPQEIVILG